MAEEEFQESEVIFSDHIISNYYSTHGDDDDAAVHDDDGGYFDYYRGFSKNGRVLHNYKNPKKNGGTKKKKKMIDAASSLPVNIPRHHGGLFHCGGEADDFDQEDEDEEAGEVVPPHVILGRRLAGKMAFSVCTGNGRRLRGRDLSQVRNSILRMTGFLEA
ncbi:hypothetical protein PTKIN_Ptkin18bG0103500 [Pterospermum kingtungense]